MAGDAHNPLCVNEAAAFQENRSSARHGVLAIIIKIYPYFANYLALCVVCPKHASVHFSSGRLLVRIN